MKVAIYARESDADTNKAPPIAAQIERGKQWAADNGHEVMTIYQDNGYSGGDWKRPEWLQSVNDAKRHLWQMLWVWNQDRIARDTEQFLWYYRNLNNAKVKIWEDTSNSPIQMETVGDRVKHQSLAQAGEIFRLITSEKVRKAYERNKAKGKPWGRKVKPIDIARLTELRAQNLGYRKIAQQLGVSYQTVRRALLRVK